MKQRSFDGTFEGFRAAAREALVAGHSPADIAFVSRTSAQKSLFGAGTDGGDGPASQAAGAPAGTLTPTPTPAQVHLPRRFVQLARFVFAHRDASRYDLLYRIAWRLLHGSPALLEQPTDRDVQALTHMQRQVARDIHHCHAYVRFREVMPAPGAAEHAGAPRTFVAWYEPEHDILALAVPHFVERFKTMRWSILTPTSSVYFADGRLRFGPGAQKTDAPGKDALEELWRTYYVHIFNPARLNMAATRSEMPKRFWRNMPETALIPELRRDAPTRAQAFIDAQPPRAATRISYPSLQAANLELKGCAVCPWSRQSSSAVPGEGPAQAALMLVGEQPGDEEDVQGRPFVGPAGQLLDRALVAAGIDRANIYVTNAVKHFKFNQRGKRRLHQKPSATDVAACKGWLAAEVALVRPRVLVCLGASAALAVRGQLTKLLPLRGRVFATGACAQTLVTGHPSAVLRAPAAEQAALFDELVAALKQAASRL